MNLISRRPDDYIAHDALICIADGEVMNNEDRRRLTPEHYFKSAQQMAALFADLPEAIESTVEIARRCAFRVKSVKPILPRFSDNEAEELRRQARDGLERAASQPRARRRVIPKRVIAPGSNSSSMSSSR